MNKEQKLWDPEVASDIWFAPMIGLRKGNAWIGLIGLELVPALPSGLQTPTLRMVFWQKDHNSQKNIKDCFAHLFDEMPDFLRYVGRWIPTTRTDPGGFNYGAAYRASITNDLKDLDFDQIVLLRASEGIPTSTEHFAECSIIIAKDGRAKLSKVNPYQIDITGSMLLPVGIPEDNPQNAASTATPFTMTLIACTQPEQEGESDNYRYAEMNVRAGPLSFSKKWNGSPSDEPFDGVGRLVLNKFSDWTKNTELFSKDVQWKDSPNSDAGTYGVSFSSIVTQIDPTCGVPEVKVRSYAMLNQIKLLRGTGAVTSVKWELPYFSQWFCAGSSPSLSFRVEVKCDPEQVADVVDKCKGDLTRVVRDGSLGDPVSFYPTIDTRAVTRLDPDNRYLFSSDTKADIQLAEKSAKAIIPVNLVRFSSYNSDSCNPSTLQLQLEVALFPRFGGWNGLDLQFYITKSSVDSVFRRSEGSLTLVFPKASYPMKRLALRPSPATSTSVPTELDYGTIRIGARKMSGCEQSDIRDPFFQIKELRLPVGSIAPYARDLSPHELLSTIDEDETADHEESPILIPLASKDSDLPYTLVVNETCEPPRVRNLRMELMRNPTDSGTSFGKDGFLVLDRTPFLFARVELPALARNDGSSSGVVFQRIIDPETGQPEWQVALDLTSADTAVRVTLPPQAIGEEMLVLEYPKPSGQLYNYRFGEAARLNLAATYYAQRFANIPWNLRKFFGYAGERDPGGAVVSLEFELLYGLAATFTASRADQPLRIAELFSRLGALPGGLPAALPWNADDSERKAWNLLQSRWQSVVRRFVARLGILQPYSEGANPDLPLTNGLAIQPRIQPPRGNDPNPIGAQLFYPKRDSLSDEVRKLLHDNATDGLGGGFLWGMQEWEAPFCQLFWDNRQSSSAEIRDLAFSSLGGWGQQVARFASNRLMIQARAAMGRTDVYTVERIGKIAVFGHKAKHVIRYERSVVGSPGSLDFIKQAAEPGRPILRKMEEYIELIEDRKDYPDHPNGQPLDTGMVQACYFPKKGTKIPIRHTWGRSMDRSTQKDAPATAGIDWEVPLWRPNADPFLYPKPQIFIEMSSGTGADARPVAQTIANPEDVYFFTTAQPGLTDDVSQWPILPDVDYVNAEEPTEWKDRETLPGQDNVPDTGWPEAVSTPPGYERFTFHLDPAQDEINLVANRRNDVMLHGRVRNVTMMRSAPGASPTPAAPANPTPAQEAAVTNVVNLRQWQRQVHLGLYELRARLTNSPESAGANLQTFWDNANARLPELDPQPSSSQGTAACQNVKNPILARLIAAGIDDITKMVTDRGRDYTLAAFRPVLDQLQAANAATNQFVASEFITQLKRLVRQAIDTLNSVVFFVQIAPERVLDALDDQLEHAFAAPLDRAHQLVDVVTDQLNEYATEAEQYVGAIQSLIDDNTGALRQLKDRIATNDGQQPPKVIGGIQFQIDKLIDELLGLVGPVQPDTAPEKIQTALKDCKTKADDFAALLVMAIANIQTSLQATANPAAVDITQALHNATAQATALAQKPLQELEARLLKLRQDICGLLAAEIQKIQDQVKVWTNEVTKELTDLQGDLGPANGTLPDLVSRAQAKVNVMLLHICNGHFDAATGKTDFSHSPDNSLLSSPSPVQQPLSLVKNVRDDLQKLLCPLANIDFGLPDVVANGLDGIKQLGAINNSWEALKTLVLSGKYTDALDELDALEHRLGVETSWLGSQIMPVANTVLNDVAAAANYFAQNESKALRTVRALCNDLRTDGLGLNRKTVAMLLNYHTPNLNLTPVLGRLNQFGNQLGSLGLRLPITQLTDRFLPDKSWLQQFDFNQIVSDCGGARLEGLLKNLKAFESMSDQVKVTQGLDKQTLRAWVQADVDVPLNGENDLFDFGPLSVVLESARFTAHLKASVDAGGRLAKEAFGQMAADWMLTIGGEELVTFKRTSLTFQDGQMHFNLDPKNVQLGGLLKMISDLASLLPSPGGSDDGAENADDGGDKGSPLKIALLKEPVQGFEIPAGVRMTLEVPAISIGATPVAVTNLQMGGFFELRALQKSGASVVFDFSVALGFHCSRKDRPFNIAIYCLGGGGWIDSGLTYHPLKSDLSADITVGIEASASLSFDIGWLSGGVGIYLGIFVEFHHRSGTGSSFAFGVMILLEGNLDLLGIIDAQLTVLLEAVYRVQGSSKSLDCTGTVDVSIKICWCFTLSLRRSFTYSMGGGGGAKSLAAIPSESYLIAADEYLNMFA